MNYLYIIGNGLDISLGLKTDYQSFYDYYVTIDSSDPDIVQMKEAIKKARYETWADLEAGLGQYSKHVDTPEVFLKCITNIKEELIGFLSGQFALRNYQKDFDKLVKDMKYPEQYLEDQVLDKYQSFIRAHSFNGIDVYSIVTFNYTNTLEDVFSGMKERTVPILHLHGSLSDSPVLGVNDHSQIFNEEFQDSTDVIEEFVKPEFNEACLNRRNARFEELIERANIIVLFGTSMGETDKRWWYKIGERMLEGTHALIIYFPFDRDKDVAQKPNYCRRWTQSYQIEVLKKLGIPEDKYAEVSDRICVGINKPYFYIKPRSKRVLDYINES